MKIHLARNYFPRLQFLYVYRCSNRGHFSKYHRQAILDDTVYNVQLLIRQITKVKYSGPDEFLAVAVLLELEQSAKIHGLAQEYEIVQEAWSYVQLHFPYLGLLVR